MLATAAAPTTFEFNCRLDYILAANASTEAAWAVEKSSLCFNDPILVPERFKNLSASDLDRVNVSDHAGLSLTLVRADGAAKPCPVGSNPSARPAVLPCWPVTRPLPLRGVWPLPPLEAEAGTAFSCIEIQEATKLVDDMLDASYGGAMPRRLVVWAPAAMLTLGCAVGLLLWHLCSVAWAGDHNAATSLAGTPSSGSMLQGLVIACLGFCGACGAVGAAVVAFLLGLGSTAPLVALGIVGCMLLALVLAPAVLFLAMLPLLAEVLLVAEASAALLVLSCLWTWICTMSAPMSATAARAQRDWLASLEPNGEMNSRHLRGARSNARVGQTGAEHHRRT